LLIVFEKPFFQAEAAILVGVLGVIGVSISFSSLGLELEFEYGMYEVEVVEEGVAKGSESRKEWRPFFVVVTSDEKFDARREDLRGGKGLFVVVRERLVVEAA